MSEELERIEQPEELALPLTGELVPLGEPARVARALAEVRELKGQLEQARRVLEQALVQEAQRLGRKTLELEGAKVTIAGGRKLVWDVSKLLELREHGLPEERIDELVRPVVEYKVDGRVARELAGAGNPEYARIIDEARVYEPRPWYARVEYGAGAGSPQPAPLPPGGGDRAS